MEPPVHHVNLVKETGPRPSQGPIVRVQILDPRAKVPELKHEGDAGFDLYTLDPLSIGPGETAIVSTGLAMEIPRGYKGQIQSRSSLAKVGIIVEGGLIDSGYRDEILMIIKNCGFKTAEFWANNRIAQIDFTPVLTTPLQQVDQLSPSPRGKGGFGSTGVNLV